MGHAVPAMLLALLLFNVRTYLTEAAVLCCFLLNVSNRSCVFSHVCPGLSASVVYLLLHIWQGYLTFSYYFICDRIVCVLVTFLPMRTLRDAYHKKFESH